jgi:hypothetical protein
MRNSERLLKCLRNHKHPLCDDCLGDLSGVRPRQQVNQLCRRMAAEGVIIRARGRCRHCTGEKLVNGLA